MKTKIISTILITFILLNAILQIPVNAIPMQETKIENLGQCEMHLQYWKEPDGIWSYIVTTMVGYRINGNLHYAYCLQRERKGVGGDQESYNVNVTEMLKDEKIWRAIINGFPYKSAEELGVENDQDAFVATKQAIYSVMYGWDVDSHFRGADERGWKIVNAIKTITNNARNGTETPNKSNVLEIKPVGEFKKENNNYYSQEYSVKASVDMSNYIVTKIENFPEGSIVTDLNNNPKTEFSPNQNFKILIPKNKILNNFEGTIKINGRVKTYPVFYGASYDENLQDYALTYDAYETVGDEITLRVNAYKSKITVIKKDGETNKPIENVEFNVKYKDGTQIGNFKTDQNGTITISNLKQGTIILTETKTQEQYVLDGTEKEIIIEYDEEKTIEIKNERKKGNITIKKVDKDDNSINLSGVEFDLIAQNGDIVKHLVTDKNGEAKAENIDIGNYILKETKTNQEYKLSLQQDITIEWNKTFNIQIENEKIKGKVKVIKTSEDDNLINGDKAGTPIANVKFVIYDEKGEIVDTLITETDGIAISKNLVKGKYIIKEIETGDAYELNEEDFTIEIKKDGEVVELEISNKSKTPPPEEPPEEPPVEEPPIEVPPEEPPEEPEIEVPPVEEPKKLPVTGY